MQTPQKGVRGERPPSEDGTCIILIPAPEGTRREKARWDGTGNVFWLEKMGPSPLGLDEVDGWDEFIPRAEQ